MSITLDDEAAHAQLAIVPESTCAVRVVVPSPAFVVSTVFPVIERFAGVTMESALTVFDLKPPLSSR